MQAKGRDCSPRHEWTCPMLLVGTDGRPKTGEMQLGSNKATYADSLRCPDGCREEQQRRSRLDADYAGKGAAGLPGNGGLRSTGLGRLLLLEMRFLPRREVARRCSAKKRDASPSTAGRADTRKRK